MREETVTSARKRDHLVICCERPIEAGDAGVGDVRLVHNAFPAADMNAIETGTRFICLTLTSPLLIAAMTGGNPDTS